MEMVTVSRIDCLRWFLAVITCPCLMESSARANTRWKILIISPFWNKCYDILDLIRVPCCYMIIQHRCVFTHSSLISRLWLHRIVVDLFSEFIFSTWQITDCLFACHIFIRAQIWLRKLKHLTISQTDKYQSFSNLWNTIISSTKDFRVHSISHICEATNNLFSYLTFVHRSHTRDIFNNKCFRPESSYRFNHCKI